MHLRRTPHSPEHRHDRACDAHPLALLDAIMDSYLRWREASGAVKESYRQWQTAARGERGNAFDRYVSALDREETAALGYRRLTEQTHA